MATADGEWTRVPGHNSTPTYSSYNKPIEKSLQDDREYRIIQLENGLSATIVHDPTADKAAASLDVAVGHLYDPVRDASSKPCLKLFLLYTMVG